MLKPPLDQRYPQDHIVPHPPVLLVRYLDGWVHVDPRTPFWGIIQAVDVVAEQEALGVIACLDTGCSEAEGEG